MSLLLVSITQQVCFTLCYTGDLTNQLLQKILGRWHTLGGQRIIFLLFNFESLKHWLLYSFLWALEDHLQKETSRKVCLKAQTKNKIQLSDVCNSTIAYVFLKFLWRHLIPVTLGDRLLHQNNCLSYLVRQLLYLKLKKNKTKPQQNKQRKEQTLKVKKYIWWTMYSSSILIISKQFSFTWNQKKQKFFKEFKIFHQS